jgi:Fe-S-cluster containining protein
MPGSLIPGDLERIQQHVGDMSGDFVLNNFSASEGPLVIQTTAIGQHRQLRVPTLVPAQREDGRCVFLTDDDKCSIHEVAPFGCSYHDTHMSAHEANKRSRHAVISQWEAHREGAPYSAWIYILNQIGLTARPFPARKQAMEEAINAIEFAKSELPS